MMCKNRDLVRRIITRRVQIGRTVKESEIRKGNPELMGESVANAGKKNCRGNKKWGGTKETIDTLGGSARRGQKRVPDDHAHILAFVCDLGLSALFCLSLSL